MDVVQSRQTTRLQALSISPHPYKWLRLDFVPPTPHLICKLEDSPNGSGILVQPALIGAHFREAWVGYFPVKDIQ